MSLNFETVAWSALQATLLACLGAAAAAALLRRRPASAARVGAVAAAAILATTALAPVKLPGVRLWFPTATEPGQVLRLTSSSPPAAAMTSTAAPDRSGVDVGAMLQSLGRSLRFARPDRSPASADYSSLVAGLFITGAVLGLVRLAVSLVYVARLRQTCLPVEDGRVTSLVDELAPRLGARRLTGVWETPALAGPAVIGWRRPRILLPPAWREWSDENLRATLAHELAHVARHDFGWRLTASVVRAIHFFNPLVHFLAQRLTLAQELAADRLAAATMGGASGYARALADMALALDGRRRLGGDPIVLPMFSSNLTRRMAMLRSTDGSDAGNGRSFFSVLAAAIIVATAVATTALQSEAESIMKTATAGVATTPFSRPRADISFFGPVDMALMVVQADDLAKMSEFAWLAGMAEQFVQQQLDEMNLGAESTPKASLAAIDYVAYAMRRVAAEEIAKNPLLIPGANEGSATMCEIAVRWIEATDVVTWLARHVPDAKVGDEAGFAYVRLKLGEVSSAAFYVAQRDPHTVVASYSVERLRTLVEGKSTTASGRRQAVDGGLATLYFNAKASPGCLARVWTSPLSIFGAGSTYEQPDPFEAARQAISDSTDEICIALDATPGGGKLACRIALGCGDESSAKRVLEGVRLIQQVPKAIAKLWKEQLTSSSVELKSLDETQRALVDGRMLGMEMFADASVEVRERGDEGADVWMEAEGQLPASVLKAIGGDEMGAPLSVTPVSTTSAASDAPVDSLAPSVAAEEPRERGAFTRPPVAPAIPGAAKDGQFFVRVGELSQRRELQVAVELLKSEVRKHWKDAFGVEGPILDLAAVEYVAGLPQLTVDGKKTKEHPESTGRLMIGSGGAVVRFKNDVDWRAWMQKYMPAAQEKTDNGLAYRELHLPAIGKEPLMVAARDSRTIVVSGGLSFLHKLVEARTSEAPAGVLRNWSDLEGGLAAAVFGDANVDRTTKTPEAPSAEVVLQNTQTFGVAFDLAPTTNKVEIRLDLTCADAALAEKVNQAISELLPLGAAALENELAQRTDEERRVNGVWLEAIKNCGVEVVSNDDGTARVRLAATATFPEYLVRAVKVADNEDAVAAPR